MATRKTKTTKARTSKPSTAATKAKNTAALRTLATHAKTIASALERAEKSQERADDLRLTAAHELASARKVCDDNKITFKAWAEENLSITYKRAIELTRVGSSDDPKAALEDLRAKNAAANRKARAKAKAKTTKSAGKVKGNDTHKPLTVSHEKAPALQAIDLAKGLDEKQRRHVAQEIASAAGLAVVSKASAADLSDAKLDNVKAIKDALKAIKASERREVLKWLQRVCKEDAENALAVDKDNDGQTIPEALRRDPKTNESVATKRAKAKRAKAA